MVFSSIRDYLNNLLSSPTVEATPCFIKTYKLFVYGTLKRDEPNNEWLTNPRNGTATFLTEAKTKKRFPLILATKYHMPFLLNWPGRGCIVEGEIFEVNVAMMGKLDKLINPEMYSREQIDIAVPLANGFTETMRCHVFMLSTLLMTEELLARRYMGKYSSAGKHGLPYISHAETKVEELEDPLKY